MNSHPERPDPGRDSDEKPPKKRKVRTRTPRPDELSVEAFEFIAAVDKYKRKHMRSFLTDAEVIEVLLSLGYALGEDAEVILHATPEEIEAFIEVREKYRNEKGRLFPSWSEVYDLLLELGYKRVGDAA